MILRVVPSESQRGQAHLPDCAYLPDTPNFLTVDFPNDFA